MTRNVLSLLLVIGVCFGGAFSLAREANAATAEEIKAQIDQHNSQIKALEADIAKYQRELDALGSQKNTLQSTISGLTITQKQLASKIQVSQNNIAWVNKEIGKLTLSIGDKEVAIATSQTAIGKALRLISETDDVSLIAQVISADNISEAWQRADEAVQFNRALGENIASLREVRTELSTNRDEQQEKKVELIALQKDLAQQKRSVDANKLAQQQLLTQTQNKEANYQALIAQKKAAEAAFGQQLIALQDQLNLIVNPGSLPKVGKGVISWPFSVAFMNSCASRSGYFGNKYCITQFFGNTPFSTANPQIYNGKGHNAIDIAVPIGTPVVAALTGTVLDTGNTDLARGCYSFGKWVMIKHSNGLNTLYSHLSTIDVGKGQQVGTGQTIGLSGMTGYATGPHLHFGVYASEGTQIMTLGQFRNATGGCASAKMPVATLTAYLNPMSYL
jgi:murein DD-endopeptidase MepM/ murein hydrolase activator NlpD